MTTKDIRPQPRPGIPPGAHLAFKGVIFEVWQWEQTMFDGTTETFEKVWRCPSVEIIATVGDKIIIERQDQPDRKDIIGVPGGMADHSEDVIVEAKRELLEETGYTSDDWSLLWSYKEKGRVLRDKYVFVARNCRKVQEPQLDAGEKIDVSLGTLDELLALTDDPHFRMHDEFMISLVKAKLDPRERAALEAAIWPPHQGGNAMVQ